jgi:hypothetical protein
LKFQHFREAIFLILNATSAQFLVDICNAWFLEPLYMHICSESLFSVYLNYKYNFFINAVTSDCADAAG